MVSELSEWIVGLVRETSEWIVWYEINGRM